jgi:hypothetical protein
VEVEGNGASDVPKEAGPQSAADRLVQALSVALLQILGGFGPPVGDHVGKPSDLVFAEVGGQVTAWRGC